MITTLTQAISYFKNFCPYTGKTLVAQAGSHKLLGNFFYGDEDVLIDCVTSKAVFPVLFMEGPEIKITEDLHSMPIELHILKPANVADYQAQAAAQDYCLAIALDLWAMMRADHKERKISIELEVTITPVYYVSIANYTGVKMNLRMNPVLDVCLNELAFN